MLQSFKLTLKSIWGDKMCSFLTMLGIIIGVAAVIILVSLTNGYMGSTVENFASMGVNQINVNVTDPASHLLDVDQAYTFHKEHTDLFGELSPNVTLPSTIKYGDGSMAPTLMTGRSEQYLEIKSYELEAGRNIMHSDIVSRQKVCAIGAYVASELYGSAQNAIEQALKIDSYVFRIIGVAKVQDEDNIEDGGTDDFMWTPCSAAVEMSRNANVNDYTFTTLGTSKADGCTIVIKNFLYETLKDEDLYRATAVSEMLDSLNEQIVMMSGMLRGIAGIPLLVAGVGVTNIIPMPVTERIREVGIRESLRADRGTIMRQFTIEVVMVSFMSGVIGVPVGRVITTVVGAAVDVSVTPTLSATIISLNVSVGVGPLFRCISAGRAANLNPIGALRSE